MTNKCRGFIAPNRQLMIQALHRQGFFMVGDLPPGTKIGRLRGMFVVRFP
ncbi:hypothetical protein N7613_00935 [Pseudomonas juntendi]|nr:hypothetical protein [Pseudomonas juntendi]MBI6912466.1 hypothetical protein [Pseudomonas juntendi]MDG9807195.1 hypothetical protein [Pseudomonas juntendi]